ncbi:MAG: dihydrodipicolinate synthase family protein [Candidatus Rokubacteria bacterium]|nr:dihydrodipicolinate synthase family protein [Candidatus Rokubacteria bacterium]
MTAKLELFDGVYPFLATPLRPETQDLDESRLRSHIDDLVREGGIHGITALGSTGEFALLSEDERRRVAEVTIDAVKGRVPVVIGTAAIATRTAVALSRHAEGAGADAIIVNPQSYWLPNEEELFEHYRAIAQAVSIPVMVYNNPGTTKVDMAPRFIARLAREFNHFTGVKESSGDIRRVQDILALTGGRMKVSIGHQSLGLAAFAVGASGWTTGIANTIPQLCVEIFELAVRRRDVDKAREVFMQILPLCDFYAEKSLTRAVKAAAEIMGKPLGPPRLPLRSLGEADRRVLRGLLADLGLVARG